MNWNPPQTDGLIPTPPAPAKKPLARDEDWAPTPEEVAADVAARQAVLDDARAAGFVAMDPAGDPEGAAKAAKVASEAAAARPTAPPPDSTLRWSSAVSAPSDPAEAAARLAVGKPQAATSAVAPPSADPIPAAPRGYVEPKVPPRIPKYLLGASIKIPGGFLGRVVAVFPGWDAMTSDPAVIAAGGPDKVLRGKQGTGIPTTKDQPFYRCRSNRFDYDLVVGELDGHMASQGNGIVPEGV